ncbi:MAG TPA: N-acetylglutaminylglutamine amidotransferase [Thermoleophilaceae bacterium]
MCGFAGEIARDGPADVEAVWRMGEAVRRRGPDGVGSWSHGRVALAHRRLSIIDLSARGAQPMVDAELGLTAVFNGCIYNNGELRDELADLGYRFFSTSDTEVLLKGWHHWGDGFVERLKGMFAFCLVDSDSGRALLGRDRLGIKPLYLAEHERGLRFASTLPALLAGGGVDTDLDPIALNHYFSWHAVVPAPYTVIKGVRKLAPATLLAIETDGRRHEQEYWRPEFRRDAAGGERSDEQWDEAVLEALGVAVERRMVADVPVGVLLSGGLDSSLIVALLAEQGQRGLTTFSIGFEAAGGMEGDEFAYSDAIAERYETEHRRIRIAGERLLPALGDAVGAMSEPMTSHDAVAFYLLSEEVSKELKVVQSGQGADEVFAGYSWYPPLLHAPGDGSRRYHEQFFDRSYAEMTQLLGPDYRSEVDAAGDFMRAHFAQPGADTPLDRALRLDSLIMLVDDPVKRVDNMTMAWGLEARTPFLDHELVELAAACPPELKLAEGGKGVLKRAARRLLPAEVIDRPKGYFPVPALSHLEGRFLELVRETLDSRAARERGLIERSYVERLYTAPNDHRTPLGSNKLWQIALLELWLQAQGV